MTQIPAGWYPDPAPSAPGSAPSQRYWDGTRWTEHVQPVEPQVTTPAPYAGQYGRPAPSAGQYGTQTSYGQPGGPAPAYARRGMATTPDGERLAGWWHRLRAPPHRGPAMGPPRRGVG